MLRKLIYILIVVLTVMFNSFAATSINNSNRYAWAANAGWINCQGDTNNGSVVGEFVCSNWVYSANLGWISFGNGSPTNGYMYSNLTAGDYGVNHDGAGNLRGFAWSANAGWINFETNGNPRVNLLTGDFDGYAWGQNIGWIGLSNLQAFVETDKMQTGPDADADGLPDMWEMSTAGDLTSLTNGNADADGDGRSDSDEYSARSNPLDTDEFLRITKVEFSGETNAAITWISRPARVYQVMENSDVANAGGWADAGPGQMLPDSSNTTTRVIPDAHGGGARNFFRVKAARPLQ